jgi:mono/diheme cytochrome c family protein
VSSEFRPADPLHRRQQNHFQGAEVSVRKVIYALGWILLIIFPVWAADDAESTYKAQCMKCHGAKGDGSGHAQMKIKPADLRSDAVQKLSDEEIYKTIAYGVGHKQYAHAFAGRGLSSKQIADLVTYIRKFARSSKKDK